eukprot:12741-Heterococcus_DN1.PRE.2
MGFVMGNMAKLLKTKDKFQIWTIAALAVILIVRAVTVQNYRARRAARALTDVQQVTYNNNKTTTQRCPSNVMNVLCLRICSSLHSKTQAQLQSVAVELTLFALKLVAICTRLSSTRRFLFEDVCAITAYLQCTSKKSCKVSAISCTLAAMLSYDSQHNQEDHLSAHIVWPTTVALTHAKRSTS